MARARGPACAADAIVVLSGSMPQRAEGAADLYRAGYAPEVWVTRPDSPEAELSEMGIRFVGEEEYSRQVLIHQGVPASAIRILPDAVINTEEEIEEITREMQSRQTSLTSSSLLPPSTLGESGLSGPDSQHRIRSQLWRQPRKIPSIVTTGGETHATPIAVVREMMGLMNAWAGLTVRPRSPRT